MKTLKNFANFALMAEKSANQLGVTPSDRCAIGISFGNLYSSIASTADDAPVVIANEDGGKICDTPSYVYYNLLTALE